MGYKYVQDQFAEYVNIHQRAKVIVYLDNAIANRLKGLIIKYC